MSDHQNNHELTRVSLREEVERTLEGVLPASVPLRQKREVFTKVEQIVERYSGPYPDPDFLRQLNEIAPGSAQEIIKATIEDLAHRREMDRRQLDVKQEELDLVRTIAANEVGSVKHGRTIGLIAYLACLTFSATSFALGSQTLALAGFGAAALGIIAQLIRGGSGGVTISTEVKPEKPKEKSGKAART